MLNRVFSIVAGCLLSTAAAAATVQVASAEQTEGVLAPNPNLLTQGIPQIPLQLVRAVQRYTDFRGHGLLDWHPSGGQILVSHRASGASTNQLFQVSAPLAPAEQITFAAEPINGASFQPVEGRFIVYSSASAGDEATQLFRQDPSTRLVTRLTDPKEKHGFIGWLNRRSSFVYSSVPLDRTASGGTRAAPTTRIALMDPEHPEQGRQIAELPGVGWFGGVVSQDDQTLALTRYVSANESEIWLINLITGSRGRLLPGAQMPLRATHFPVGFKADGTGIFVISDRFGEFRELLRYDFQTGAFTRVTADIPWDVSSATLSQDGRHLAVQSNQDGRDVLRLFNALTLQPLALPALPEGNVGVARFNPAGTLLGFSINSAKGPAQIYQLELATGQIKQFTQALSPVGVDPGQFQEQEIIRWRSFDGRAISGLLSRPPARFNGKRPVLINIHGGPEGQATIGFLGRTQYFIQELGIAVIQPNVRGSTGFGKTFLDLDNGRLREDSVKDIGSLLDWIATQPDLDASKVLVMGGSYGGYMSLAVAFTYAERIVGAIDVVGISHFVTFLERTESYRRDLRRVEYGDERDPEMRAFLDRISPLTNAEKIKKPLFVIQGKNDPRVPFTEAEQIVAKTRSMGIPVWYLRAENEGHGFARKENADYQFFAMILFMNETLGVKLPH